MRGSPPTGGEAVLLPLGRASLVRKTQPTKQADIAPYGSDEVRRYDEPLSRLRRQLPLGRGAKGRGSFSWARPYGGELARSA